MVGFFYNMEGLPEEERSVYQSPRHFKELLTSPWIRIVKNQHEDDIGVD